MKNENNKLDKLYLEQEKELGLAEWTLDAVTNQSSILCVCDDQTLSEFLKGEEMLDIGHRMENTEGGFYYQQYFTNGKQIQHDFKKDGTVLVRFLQDNNQSTLDRLNSIKKNIETAIELQKQIEPLEEEECI